MVLSVEFATNFEEEPLFSLESSEHFLDLFEF